MTRTAQKGELRAVLYRAKLWLSRPYRENPRPVQQMLQATSRRHPDHSAGKRRDRSFSRGTPAPRAAVTYAIRGAPPAPR